MRKALLKLALVLATLPGPGSVWAVGTIAGTDIDNTAEVTYEVGGAPLVEQSNTLTVTVAEILDVDVTLQSPPRSVAPGDASQELLFTLTNTGNGSEAFLLVLDSAVAGDDFDPTPSAPASIYFDTDGSGDLSAGDTPYDPGVNDPLLVPDSSVDILIVNDIPATAADGEIGRSQLLATAVTGSGAPGSVFAGAGDGGVDAVAGTSGAAGDATGEYLATDIMIEVVKSATVADPFGGNEPVPGAQITYIIVVTPSGGGLATNTEFNDAVPTYTTYVGGTLRLNGTPMTDAPDADAGQLISAATPAINVVLGDLTAASGPQTIEFTVTID